MGQTNRKKLKRRKKKKVTRRSTRRRLNNKKDQKITHRMWMAAKTRFVNYISSFHKVFIKNAIIASLIFIVLLLFSQFNFSWNQNLLDYVHTVSKEGIDFSNLNQFLDQVYELFKDIS